MKEQWIPLNIRLRGDDSTSLSTLLRDLAAEISRVVSDDLIDGKPGRKKTNLEHGIACILRECFKKHGLKDWPNTWPDASCPLTDCLEIIFNTGENFIERDALATYLKDNN